MNNFSEFLQKKKNHKFNWLWVIMLIALFAMVYFGQSVFAPLPAAAPTATPVSAATPTPAEFLPDYDTASDPVLAATETDTRPFWQIALDMGWKLLLVIGLVYATLLGLRWLQKFKNPLKDGGATIQVLETVGLAPGRSLHLVVVGEKTLLLGSTEQHIALLSELADAHIPLPDETVAEDDEPSAFEQALAHAEPVAVPVPEPPVTSPPWQVTISRLHHDVQSMRQTVGGFNDDLA